MGILAIIAGFIIFGILALLLAISILSIIDRYRYPQIHGKELQKLIKELEERLLNPDYESVEKHFGHSLSPSLRALYEDKETILKYEFSTVKEKDHYKVLGEIVVLI